MAAYHAEYLTDLAKPSRVIQIPHQFAMGDNESHTFSALVYDSEDPECGLLTGTVSGVVVRPDGWTVPLTGTKGDAVETVNLPDGTTAQATRCSLTLIQGCFAYAGQITIVIRLCHNDQQTTVFVGRGTVVPSLTDTTVDPGEVVPGVDELQQLAEDCVEALATIEDRTLTDEIKTALLSCFSRVAWATPDGQDWYDALSAALNPPANLSSITAVYTQTGTVYRTDALSVLRSGLVVTANYSDSTSAVVFGYALSGTLTEGTSTITVTYGGKTTTFNVTVTDADNIYTLAAPVTFTGVSSEMVDTGVVAMPSDRDTTFLIEATPAADIAANRFMFYTGTVSSPYRSIGIKAYVNSGYYGTALRVETTDSAKGYSLTNASYGSKVRIVLRYTAGASGFEVFYKPDGGVITNGVTTDAAVVSPSTNLRLGDFSSTSGYAYKGEISEFRLYKRKFSDDEVAAWLNAGGDD